MSPRLSFTWVISTITSLKSEFSIKNGFVWNRIRLMRVNGGESINVELTQQSSPLFTLQDSLVQGSAVVPIPVSQYQRTQPRGKHVDPEDLRR